MSEVITATNLIKGNLIAVRVKAQNIVGYSDVSNWNTSGATIKVKPQAPTTSPTRNSLTSTTQIVVDFGPLDSSMNGGSDITSYALQMQVSGVWQEVIGISSPNLSTTATAASPAFTITSGDRYTFRWMAINIFGTSDPSPTSQILAATIPDQPSPVSISVLTNGDLQISWTEPTNTGGSGVLITDHIVEIKSKDGNYYEDNSLWDGSIDPSLTSLICEFRFSGLLLLPFRLVQGNLVKAIVQVKNEIGWSIFSSEIPDASAIPMQTVPLIPSAPTRDSSTTSTQLVVNWSQISSPNDGGSPIISYNLQYDAGSGATSWVDLIGNPTNSLVLTYTFTGSITAGKTYNFRMRVLNLQGWSSYSNITPIIAASVPGSPSGITTSYDASNVKISWTAPASNGGSPITSYTIKIKASDGTYNTDISEWNGANSLVISGTTCEVAMNTLIASPFSLVRGDLIVAQITASNVIGTGSSSENTSGVTILTVPDAPTLTPTRGSLTNKNQIEVIYSFSSTLNGGSTVTSLNLWWNRGSSDNTWESLTGYSPVSLSSDYLVTGLTPGEDYQFKYRASNIYGWGSFSAISTIPASKEPNTPSAPSTLISGTSVGISWSLPDNQGATVI